MTDVKADVYARLDAMGIEYAAIEHEPLFTIEQCHLAEARLGALVPKNLFLTPRNRSAFYLLIARGDREFRTADISKQIGSSRLSFANAEDLMRLMRTKPGAISPMGLLFDDGRAVELLIDSALRDAPVLAFHPCDNAATLSMSGSDFFERFLPDLGRTPGFVRMD